MPVELLVMILPMKTPEGWLLTFGNQHKAVAKAFVPDQRCVYCIQLQ